MQLTLFAGVLISLFNTQDELGGQVDLAALAAKVAAAETPWPQRLEAEAELEVTGPERALPHLLPYRAKDLPASGFYNSVGTDAELVHAPAPWQAFYVVGRLWNRLLTAAPPGALGKQLVELLTAARSDAERGLLAAALAQHWSDAATAPLRSLLGDASASDGLRAQAADTLLAKVPDRHFDDVMAQAERSPFELKAMLFDPLMRHARPRQRRHRDAIVRLGLALLEERFPTGEDAYLHDHKQSEQVQVVASLERFLRTKFFPDQAAPQYNGGPGLQRYYDEAKTRALKYLRERTRSPRGTPWKRGL